MNSTNEIEELIALYAASIDRADTNLAKQIWSAAPEVTFIHPRGEERGRDQIIATFYEGLMGTTFFRAKACAVECFRHRYGDTAWAEFGWDFVATVSEDSSPFRSQGRETQVYRCEDGEWRIIHVYYSGAPVTGSLQGFSMQRRS